MSKIISVNAGSSSLKFQLFEMDDETVITSGVIERIGLEDSIFTIKYNGEKDVTTLPIENHKVAVQLLLDTLIKKEIVKDLDEIKGVGHRVVQGGAYFDKTVIADEDAVSKIDELASLAPLHNPAAIVGINAAKEVMPNAVQTVVFDTAFHQTMAPCEYMYAVPYAWYKEYGIRKYGAHGTSHKYVSQRMNEILGRNDTKLITCHIGNGASISAVKDGKCVDTSMGLTPNAGLIMGSRCGDMDATVVTYAMEKTGMTPKEMDIVLNKQSGLLGISGVSSDSRDIEEGIKN